MTRHASERLPGSVRVMAILVMAAGAVLVVAGVGTWFVVQSTLADERITVAEDAAHFAGDAVDGVDQLFVGPYDLSLTLGTTVPALLDDDSDASPLTRIVQAATAYGRTVGGFAGTPELAERFRERGISCVAVASDLWITAEGARAALH